MTDDGSVTGVLRSEKVRVYVGGWCCKET